MDWRLEVLRRAIYARLPYGSALRKFKRRYFGYEPDPTNLLGTLSDLERMNVALGAVGRSFNGATVLEVGSGWFPTIPIMLAVESARLVVMTDATPHMDSDTFNATLRFLKSRFPQNVRLSAVSRIEDLPIIYRAPFRTDDVLDGSIDIILSRTVLEHIPRGDIVRLLADLRPKLTPDGVMIHVIDNSDHLEHGDKSIPRINFLTWSERKHAFINRLMRTGENRLRHHEYPSLFAGARLEVIGEWAQIHEPTRELAPRLRLAAPYSSMSAKELATLTSTYVVAPMRFA